MFKKEELAEEIVHFQRIAKSVTEFWEFVLDSPQRVRYWENSQPLGRLSIKVWRWLKPYFEELGREQQHFTSCEWFWWDVVGLKRELITKIFDDFDDELKGCFTQAEYQLLKYGYYTDKALEHIPLSPLLKASFHFVLRGEQLSTMKVEKLASLQNFRSLEWWNPNYDSTFFDFLSKLHSLKRLSLVFDLKREYRSLEGIQKLQQLDSLKVEGGEFSFLSKDMENLLDLKKLKSLELDFRVKDLPRKIWERLGNFSSLEHFKINKEDFEICDEILIALFNLKKLSRLVFQGRGEFSPKIFEAFQSHSSLTELNLKIFRETPLESILTLKNLKYLSLSVDEVENQRMKEEPLTSISNMDQLKGLEFSGLNISDRILSTFCSLSELDFLSLLFNPKASDKGLSFIADLKKLRVLRIVYLERITGEIFQVLSKATTLEHFEFLSIPNSKRRISKAQFCSIESLVSLKTLSLNFPEFRDDFLKHLSPLKNLTYLDLSNTPVEGDGLKNLIPLPKLSTIILNEKVVDPQKINEFLTLKPNCKIFLHQFHSHSRFK